MRIISDALADVLSLSGLGASVNCLLWETGVECRVSDLIIFATGFELRAHRAGSTCFDIALGLSGFGLFRSPHAPKVLARV